VYTRFKETSRRRIRRLSVVTAAGMLGAGSVAVAMDASAAEATHLLIQTTAGIGSIHLVTTSVEAGGANLCVATPGPAVYRPLGDLTVEVGTAMQVLTFSTNDCTVGLIVDCRTAMASGAQQSDNMRNELDAATCQWLNRF